MSFPSENCFLFRNISESKRRPEEVGSSCDFFLRKIFRRVDCYEHITCTHFKSFTCRRSENAAKYIRVNSLILPLSSQWVSMGLVTFLAMIMIETPQASYSVPIIFIYFWFSKNCFQYIFHLCYEVFAKLTNQ